MAFIEPMHRNKPNITYLLNPMLNLNPNPKSIFKSDKWKSRW